VVCHQAVARCLLAYFQNVPNLESQLPYLKVPLHTVYKITPIPYGNRIEMYELGVSAVDTHRPKLDSEGMEEPMPETPTVQAFDENIVCWGREGGKEGGGRFGDESAPRLVARL